MMQTMIELELSQTHKIYWIYWAVSPKTARSRMTITFVRKRSWCNQTRSCHVKILWIFGKFSIRIFLKLAKIFFVCWNSIFKIKHVQIAFHSILDVVKCKMWKFRWNNTWIAQNIVLVSAEKSEYVAFLSITFKLKLNSDI